MSKKSAKDIRLWSLSLLIILISVCGFSSWYFTSDNSAQNYYADKTGITWIILGLFFVALMINAINTLSIFVQFRYLKDLEGLHGEILFKNAQGLFGEHIKNLQQASQNKLSLEQEFSLSFIENKLLRKESWVGLFSNLMITLGMIGTILGLTTAMTGLSEAMSSLGENFDNSNSPLIGLNDALSGMSSAFITTLAGAILGGFFLKIISHSTTNLIEDLIDNIRQKTELEVIPYLQEEIWSREKNNLNEAYAKLITFKKLLKEYTLSMTEAVEKINFMVTEIETKYSPEKIKLFRKTLNSNTINSTKQIELALKLLVAVVIALLLVGIFIGWVVVTKI